MSQKFWKPQVNYTTHTKYENCILLEGFKKFKIINDSEYICKYKKRFNEPIVIEHLNENNINTLYEKFPNDYDAKYLKDYRGSYLIKDANGACLDVFKWFRNLIAVDENNQAYEFFYMPVSFKSETMNWKGEKIEEEECYIAIQIYRKVQVIEMTIKTNKENNNQ